MMTEIIPQMEENEKEVKILWQECLEQMVYEVWQERN